LIPRQYNKARAGATVNDRTMADCLLGMARVMTSDNETARKTCESSKIISVLNESATLAEYLSTICSDQLVRPCYYDEINSSRQH
jgi:hypothetical protein